MEYNDQPGYYTRDGLCPLGIIYAQQQEQATQLKKEITTLRAKEKRMLHRIAKMDAYLDSNRALSFKKADALNDKIDELARDWTKLREDIRKKTIALNKLRNYLKI